MCRASRLLILMIDLAVVAGDRLGDLRTHAAPVRQMPDPRKGQ